MLHRSQLSSIAHILLIVLVVTGGLGTLLLLPTPTDAVDPRLSGHMHTHSYHSTSRIDSKTVHNTISATTAVSGDSNTENHGSSVTTTACTYPLTVTDATGTTVRIMSDPDRVVTLNPSAAQTMWEIGAQNEVVGVSRYASYLNGTASKQNVSGAGGPSVERVLAATPDLVLVPNSTHSASPDRIAQLRAQGLTLVVFPQATSLTAVIEKTERIGRLTGNCAAGDARATELQQSINRIERVTEDTDRPVGVNVFYGYTSGNNTFIDEIIETGGLENGAANAGLSGFVPITDESVVAIDPTWIVIPTSAPLPKTPAYNSTTAYQNNNIIRVETEHIQQPAPRAIYAVETILQATHPAASDEYQQLETTTPSANTSSSESSESNVSQTTARQMRSTPSGVTATQTNSPGFGIVHVVFTAIGSVIIVCIIFPRE